MVELAGTIKDRAKLESLVMDKLKAGKSQELVRCVEKYAVFFLEEFFHFLRIHGFLKDAMPQVNRVKSEPPQVSNSVPSPATMWFERKKEVQLEPKRKPARNANNG